MIETAFETEQIVTITQGCLAGTDLVIRKVEGQQITAASLMQRGVFFAFSSAVLERIAQPALAVS